MHLSIDILDNTLISHEGIFFIKNYMLKPQYAIMKKNILVIKNNNVGAFMAQIVVKPKIMKNICISAHPLGCEKLVQEQINYIQQKISATNKDDVNYPKNVLIIGGSAGYGLATRIACAYGYNAKTLNVAFEVPAMPEKKRTASVGWYNTHAFEDIAQKDGLWAQSIFGDAFSQEIKQKTIETIKNTLGKVDLVIYSLASGKRVDPETGKLYTSVLKPIGKSFSERTLDVLSGKIQNVSVTSATEEEIEHTVKVMGGEDWNLWMKALLDADVLSENSLTIAYSYIGPELTQDLYRHGTIGKAKEHLEDTAHTIDMMMQSKGIGRAYVSVNKALVTRASMVIPTVPLYLSILYKVMKEKNIHEYCIEQMHRMLEQKIYNGKSVITDEKQRIRVDDWEMRSDVQEEVIRIWNIINEENLLDYADVQHFTKDFYNIHGFMWDGISYEEEVEI